MSFVYKMKFGNSSTTHNAFKVVKLSAISTKLPKLLWYCESFS